MRKHSVGGSVTSFRHLRETSTALQNYWKIMKNATISHTTLFKDDTVCRMMKIFFHIRNIKLFNCDVTETLLKNRRKQYRHLGVEIFLVLTTKIEC